MNSAKMIGVNAFVQLFLVSMIYLPLAAQKSIYCNEKSGAALPPSPVSESL